MKSAVAALVSCFASLLLWGAVAQMRLAGRLATWALRQVMMGERAPVERRQRSVPLPASVVIEVHDYATMETPQ